jgi:hypothetical protein
MKTMIVNLRLSTNLDGRTRERCPDVVMSVDSTEVASIRTDVEQPQLPVRDGEIDVLEIRDDALSRVMDEEAWMAELARVIPADGEMRLTLPASGALAWLDTMNLYRYIADISKRGHAPDASLPTGWNRHYSPEDIARLLRVAGFEDTRIQRSWYAGDELAFLGTMMWRNWIRGERRAELETYPKFAHRTPGARRFPIGTTWSITARKPR